jgi:hypothetical protein
MMDSDPTRPLPPDLAATENAGNTAENGCSTEGASLARRGLDALLKQYPTADLAWTRQQDEKIMEVYREQIEPSQYNTEYWLAPGPWLCVDLYVNGRIEQFAIWNRTGNVYRIFNGAAEDDPFISITNV